jgi:AcrR family transcriptional regulator
MSHAAQTDLRERLFQVALAHTRQRGYAQSSVSQITLEVGVAKGTFFNHFPTKDHILAEVLHRWVEDCISDVDSLAGAEAVLAFLRSVASRFSGDRKVGEAVVLHFADLPGVQVSQMGGAVRSEDRVRDWIEARLTEALPVAVPLVEVRPGLLAFVLTCVFRGTLEEWVRGQQEARSLGLAIGDRISYVLRASGLPASPWP